ncbi:hypothetical protein [Paenibacillus sp. NPDC058071]|uniref:hypothetical protein n=1 Tax=Paenibacillus sp. NPDC058071 TaxID=3346326 RepID=UPI0036DC19F4
MLYWIILGGIFLFGGAYVMLNGAKLVREDNEIQDKIFEGYKQNQQEKILS